MSDASAADYRSGQGRSYAPIGQCLQTEDLGSAMDQFAAKRNAQELCIRFVSGPRNQKLLLFQQFSDTLQPSELTISWLSDSCEN
jgi:hypothetical protein